MSDFDEDLRELMRQFIADKGRPVDFRQDWDGRWTVSEFGWVDYDADDHVRSGCSWVIPLGTLVEEVRYSQFTDTGAPNREEVGVNAMLCHCKCGQYKDVTLRVIATLGEAIQALLKYDSRKMAL